MSSRDHSAAAHPGRKRLATAQKQRREHRRARCCANRKSLRPAEPVARLCSARAATQRVLGTDPAPSAPILPRKVSFLQPLSLL